MAIMMLIWLSVKFVSAIQTARIQSAWSAEIKSNSLWTRDSYYLLFPFLAPRPIMNTHVILDVKIRKISKMRGRQIHKKSPEINKVSRSYRWGKKYNLEVDMITYQRVLTLRDHWTVAPAVPASVDNSLAPSSSARVTLGWLNNRLASFWITTINLFWAIEIKV